MRVPRLQLAHTLANETLEKGFSEPQAREIAAYLLEEGRTDELDSLMRDVRASWAEDGFVEALAYCAQSLSAVTKELVVNEVKKYYPNATKIVVTEVNDPSIIASVRISLPHRQLDLSVRAKLNKLKQLTVS